MDPVFSFSACVSVPWKNQQQNAEGVSIESQNKSVLGQGQGEEGDVPMTHTKIKARSDFTKRKET